MKRKLFGKLLVGVVLFFAVGTGKASGLIFPIPHISPNLVVLSKQLHDFGIGVETCVGSCELSATAPLFDVAPLTVPVGTTALQITVWGTADVTDEEEGDDDVLIGCLFSNNGGPLVGCNPFPDNFTGSREWIGVLNWALSGHDGDGDTGTSLTYGDNSFSYDGCINNPTASLNSEVEIWVGDFAALNERESGGCSCVEAEKLEVTAVNVPGGCPVTNPPD